MATERARRRVSEVSINNRGTWLGRESKLLNAVGAVMLLLVVSACSPSASSSPSPSVAAGATLTGTITVYDPAYAGYGSLQSCTGEGGYGDITEGTQVTVRDGSGTVLQIGALETGRVAGAQACGFGFTIAEVPGADFYSIEVSHRGEVTYTAADLEAAAWHVELNLGR